MDDATPTGIDPSALLGERIADRFVVERSIGQGPLSSAFRAHDERLHRRVTVKLFHPRHRDDAHVVRSQLASARAVARLSHEHIALVIDQGEHAGMPLVVFEYVRGENLQERIERYAPLGADDVVRFGLQIARALTYAHGHGVVHGNLRPANVLLTEDRDVKLVDFGGGSYVAQLVGDPYAAPELSQVDPDAPAEPSDDVYALGALLFTSLTEQPAAPDIMSADVQLLRPDVSARFADVLAQSLAADPARRPGSMREIAAELSAVYEQTPRGRGASTGAFGAVVGADDTAQMDTVDAGTAELRSSARRAQQPEVRRPRQRSRARSPRERGARLLAWSMVVVPLLALVLVGVMIAGERSQEPKGKPDPSATGAEKVLPVSSVVTMDPEPEGDGSEHADEAANAIDGDTTTTWQTEGYDTGSFANLKPGVGLVLNLAEQADVRDVQIFTRLPGWRVQIYVAATPQPKLSGWKAVSEVVPVRDAQKIPVRMRDVKLPGLPEGRAQVILLWITSLSLDVDEPNKSRARLGDVRVYGATDS